MKKIYSITLDDDVPLSDNIGSDIREIAFWLYEELGKFNKPIVCFDSEKTIDKSGLIKNELYDIRNNGKYEYKFASDYSKVDSRMFEPFVLNNNTFAFTTYDGAISDTEIAVILENVLKILRLDYHFSIDSITYDDKSIRNRFGAIDKLTKKKKIEQVKVKKRTKLQIQPIVSMLGLW